MRKQKHVKDTDELVLSSIDQIRAEVKRELNSFIRKERRDAKKNKDKVEEKKVKKEEETLEKILVKQEEDLKKDIERVNNLSDSEKVDWLIEKHDSYVKTIDQLLRPDFLNGTEYFDRYLIVTYMQQLITLLATYDIEFNKEMIDLLINKGYVELISILNVLNYI
ncbi:MAG TPA: hypothetical protein P5136_02740 [Methanofastidiosum sp.]|nr:hypothetical protein [Methanofastidiosum sp.]